MPIKEKLKEFEKWLIERKANVRLAAHQESFVEATLNSLPHAMSSLTYLNHGNRIIEPFADAVIAFIKHQIDTFGRRSVEPSPERRNYYELDTTAESKSERIEAWIKCMKSEGRVAPVQEARLKAILNRLPEDDRLSESLRQFVNATPSLLTSLAKDDAEASERKNAEDSGEEIALRIKMFQQSKTPLTGSMESAIIEDFERRTQQAKREKDPARAWVLNRCLGSFKGGLKLKSVRHRRDLFNNFSAFIDLDILFDKRHADSIRLKAAQRILAEQIKRPIHTARWRFVKKELDRLAKNSGRSRELELNELAKASLFDAIEALGGVKLTSRASFNSQISTDYKTIWRRLNDLLTELLAGPGWREKESPRTKVAARRHDIAASRAANFDPDTGPTAQPTKAPNIKDPTYIADDALSPEKLFADAQSQRERQKLQKLVMQQLSLVTGKKPEYIARLIEKRNFSDIKTLASALGIERTRLYREIVNPIRKGIQKN